MRCVNIPFLVLTIFHLAGFGSPAQTQVVSIDDIPNPQPAGWSVDLTGQVSGAALDSIDRLGHDVAAQLDGQIAVVVVQSIGSAVPRTFATSLFNTWGIGNAGRNNGVLVFVALGDRNAEIILGDGVDGRSQIDMANQIMQQLMVPRLRQGDVTNAVLLAAQAAVERILRPLRPNVNLAPIGNLPPEAEGDALPPPGTNVANVSDAETGNGGSTLPIVGGIVGLAGLLGLGGRRFVRYRPRTCHSCGTGSVRLGEAQDDVHLEAHEQVEERLGSVDYDVWACPNCGDVQKLRYGAVFTTYSKCPRCRAKTKNKKKRTIQAATRWSDGLLEITERCANCNYVREYTRAIPQLTESSSGSSSGSSSSSSGFGGGTSSGSGASGSW